MATLTVATAAIAGADIVGAAAAGGGDAFANTGQEYLLIKNGDSGSHTVTFDTPATVAGLALANPAVAVGAGVTKLIGPFPPSLFNDANGLAQMTYDAVTSVTVKVFKCTPA